MNQEPTVGNLKKVGNYVFDLDGVLGIGCFGKVYRGREQGTRNTVAVKVIERHFIENKPAVEYFLSNEIKVMQSLRNPNIVQLKDILHTANNIYIVQEFCKDGDLRAYLNKNGKILSEKEAQKILKDILNGFVEMIKIGVVHRDLKPENILINDGIFKIADFGFSKHVSNHTNEILASAVGTPLYMAPQIQMCEKYSTKSDIWSIGMIYFEMLFGKVPWSFSTTYELINNILKKKLQIPDTPEVSELSKDFIRGALQVKEADRFSWKEVFMHPLVQEHFQYKDKISKLNKKFRGLVLSIKEKIIDRKLDIDALFRKIDENRNNRLDIHEFAKLFKLIDDKITREEVEYCFNRCDSNNDNSISIEEFKKIFEEPRKRKIARAMLRYLKDRREKFSAQIARLDSRNSAQTPVKNIEGRNSSSQSKRKMVEFENTQVDNQRSAEKLLERAAMLSQYEENSMKILKRMKDTIRIAKMDLRRVFWTFDKDNNKTLDETEFGKFIKLIEKDVKTEEIQFLFNYFDDNGDGLITSEEFVEKFQEVVELPVQKSSEKLQFNNLRSSAEEMPKEINKESFKENSRDSRGESNSEQSKSSRREHNRDINEELRRDAALKEQAKERDSFKEQNRDMHRGMSEFNKPSSMNQAIPSLQLPPKKHSASGGAPPSDGTRLNKIASPKYQIYHNNGAVSGAAEDQKRRESGNQKPHLQDKAAVVQTNKTSGEVWEARAYNPGEARAYNPGEARAYNPGEARAYNPVVAPSAEQRISSGSQKGSARANIANQGGVYLNLDEKVSRVLGRIRTIVNRMNLDLSKIFWSFDKDNNQALDYSEFKKLIQLIDQESVESEIMDLFRRFDTNGDGSITFFEFQDAVNGTDNSFKKKSFETRTLPTNQPPLYHLPYRTISNVPDFKPNNGAPFVGGVFGGMPPFTNFPNMPPMGNVPYGGYQTAPIMPIFK